MPATVLKPPASSSSPKTAAVQVSTSKATKDKFRKWNAYYRMTNGRMTETSMTAANDLVVRHTVEAAGVEFIDENGGGRGVRLRKSQPSRMHQKLATKISTGIFLIGNGLCSPSKSV